MTKTKLSKIEFQFVLILALALGARQLAMSLIVPFVASYAQSLLYGTLTIGGIALGIFSLTQGIFQVPFGSLCDKIGNKKVVLLGLFILICGLLLACVSDNAYIYIISRALQGSGAITAAGYSWISQKVPNEKLADSIGIVGSIVGLSAALSLGGGPLLIRFFTVKELYIFSTILVTIVFLLVLVFLKEDATPKTSLNKEVPLESKSSKSYLKTLFKTKSFIAFLVLAFSASFIGIAGFFIIPEYLDKTLGTNNVWIVLTPSVILSIIFMRLSIKFVKKGFTKTVVIVASLCLVVGALLLFVNFSTFDIFFEAVFIFTGYTILTTLIPTITNSIAKDEFRGALNGIVNSATYIGSFLGATITGLLWSSNKNLAISIIVVFAIISILLASTILAKSKLQKAN